VSATATSADESKEVIDEKTERQNAPVIESSQAPTSAGVVATSDRQLPASEALPVQSNAEPRPSTSSRQAPVISEPVNAAPQTNAAPAEREIQPAVVPVQMHQPTPVIAQQEDEVILDQTPEQAQRDHEIEMSNSGPSLPLSEKDAQEVVEEENQAYERKVSQDVDRNDLPPPPPIQAPDERRDVVATDTSLPLAPEPPQKWLLPPLRSEFTGRKCLVLDLDETLVHSSFKVSIFCLQGCSS